MAYKQEYMELAIELAKKGTGAVNPNPLVGAVIVKDRGIMQDMGICMQNGQHLQVLPRMQQARKCM